MLVETAQHTVNIVKRENDIMYTVRLPFRSDIEDHQSGNIAIDSMYRATDRFATTWVECNSADTSDSAAKPIDVSNIVPLHHSLSQGERSSGYSKSYTQVQAPRDETNIRNNMVLAIGAVDPAAPIRVVIRYLINFP